MSREKEIYHAIALQLIPNMGNMLIRQLLAHFKTFTAIFEADADTLRDAGASSPLIQKLKDFDDWNLVDQEMRNIEDNHLNVVLLTEESFPKKLMLQEGLPVLLFYKGNIEFNPDKSLSIVGTRAHSNYGSSMTRKVVEELKPHAPTIFSGLAFGIDVIAHRAALEHHIPTVGVLAHGLRHLYPADHRATVKRMIDQGGGIITSYLYDVPGLPALFAERNKIVATIADALLVVESATSGGSMITANLAYDYNRDVFAIPGRSIDPKSAGPNYLISRERAMLVQSGNDIAYKLGWEQRKNKKPVVQASLFTDLNSTENKIIDLLRKGETHLEILAQASALSSSQINSTLLQLELKGVVKALPGKIYRLLS